MSAQLTHCSAHTQAAEGLPRRRFTVAEMERMTEAGILPEDERLELIGGEVVPMSPKGVIHETMKKALARFWYKAVPDTLDLISETTFRLSEDTCLEPDFLVFRSAPDALRTLDASAALLVVEVVDSSLAFDLMRKSRIYAGFGVRELWVIDAARLVTRIHRAPRVAESCYAEVADHGPDALLTPSLTPELAVRLSALGLEPAKQ
jgi:Uma2 family endonuclease